MSEPHAQLVAEALVEALELMGFIFAMPPEDSAAAPQDAIDIRLSFEGSPAGEARLVAPLELGRRLAANILPPDTPAEEMPRPEDSLGELANVATGVLIRRLAGQTPVAVRMGLPRVEPFDAAGWTGLAAAELACVLDAEGLMIALAFAPQPAAAPQRAPQEAA